LLKSTLQVPTAQFQTSGNPQEMPKFRQKKTSFFLGCEGESEFSLSAYIQELINESSNAFHLVRIIARGGSGLRVVEKSISERAKRIRTRGEKYAESYVLLDDDKWDSKKNQALTLARRENITLLIQTPNIEAALGRILSKNPTLGAARALNELSRKWPDYPKNFDKIDLAKRNARDGLLLYAENNRNWATFFRRINLLPRE